MTTFLSHRASNSPLISRFIALYHVLYVIGLFFHESDTAGVSLYRSAMAQTDSWTLAETHLLPSEREVNQPSSKLESSKQPEHINSEQSRFCKLPTEIILNILSYLQPRDILATGHTSRTLHQHTDPRNNELWRQAYLNAYDKPIDKDGAAIVFERTKPLFEHYSDVELSSWFRAVKGVGKVLKDVGRPSSESGPITPLQASVLLALVDTADVRPRRDGYDSFYHDSTNLAMLQTAFNKNHTLWQGIHDFSNDIHVLLSDILEVSVSLRPGRRTLRSMVHNHNDWGRRAEVSPEQSRLHVLYGLTNRELKPYGAPTPSRTAARALVYSWSSTDHTRDYGPFKANGEVNWRVFEAVHTIMVRNWYFTTNNGSLGHPTGFSHSAPGTRPIDPQLPEDWALVTGTWIGTYSYLDYNDLFAFNTNRRADQGRSLQDFDEQHGDIMKMPLTLDSELEAADDLRLRTHLPVYKAKEFPVLYFSGTSGGHTNGGRPFVQVRGRVYRCPPRGSESRWTFIIK